MKVLQKGDKGPAVIKWQQFLIGQRQPIIADGDFGAKTERATISFQEEHAVQSTGKLDNATLGIAITKGYSVVVETANKLIEGPNWPPPPKFKPIVSTVERQKTFGKFKFVSAPTPDNPEAIRITDNWASQHIVKIELPELHAVAGAPSSHQVYFHKLVQQQLQGLWSEWQKQGLLDRVLTWGGSYVPRFIRGSRTILSNHAFGTAFDINVAWNPLGAIPAKVGEKGSVRELVQIANEFGFYWGGHFTKRLDGMHFEIAVLK